MRILYHHRTASKDGQAVHIEEMIEALRAQGHQVRMVAPGAGEGASTSVGQMGGDVTWVHRLKAHLPKAICERYNLSLLSGATLKKRLGIPTAVGGKRALGLRTCTAQWRPRAARLGSLG